MNVTSYARTVIFIVTLMSSDLTAEETTQLTSGSCQQKFTLEEFRAQALKNSALVAEIDRNFSYELANAFETEALSNPELQVEQTLTKMKIGGANDSQTQASIGQPIRLSNFGTRGKVAELIRKSGNVQQRMKLLEFMLRLTQQFRTLSTLQQIRKINTDAELSASKKLQLIRNGVSKGLLSDGDQHLFEGEKYRFQAQLKQSDLAISQMQYQIANSTNVPCTVEASSVMTLDNIPSEAELLNKASLSELSESSRVDLLLKLTQEQVGLAELDAFPQITPKFIYQHTNDGGDFYGAGISMPLPFWNRNQGGQLRAQADSRLAETQAAFIRSGGFTTQIITVRRAAISSQEQTELYTTKVVPAFEKAFNAQEKQYFAGKGSVLQVWQALRGEVDAKTQALQLALEATSLRIQLSILIGEEI